MPLRLIFWNCGVAPTRGNGRRSLGEVVPVIESIFRDGVDLVALCEVDQDVLTKIRRGVRAGNVLGYALADPIGRSRWDMGLLYDRRSVRIRRSEPAFARENTRYIRAAHSVRVTDRAADRLFRLYISHWPSRLMGNGARLRNEAAMALRNSVARDLARDLPVVIMGDFNDEPFDRTLTTLRASRDPRHVMKAPRQRLFNPSWGLSAPLPDRPWERFGSCAHDGPTSTRYLYDQALTSAHFLNEVDRIAPRTRLLGLPRPKTSRILDHEPLELALL